MMNENDSDAPDLGDEPDLDEAPEEFEGSLLPEPPHPALDALRDVEPDELTPREALEKLYELTRLARS